MNTTGQKFYNTYIAANTLVVYRNLLQDPIFPKLLDILAKAVKQKPGFDILSDYYDFYSCLVEKGENSESPSVGNLWQNHLLNIILTDENPFSLRCEKLGLSGVGEPLKNLTKKDLTSLKNLYDFDFSTFTAYLRSNSESTIDFPKMYSIKDNKTFPYPRTFFIEKQKIKTILHKSNSWDKSINQLADFYKEVGCGKFARYWTFKWTESKNGGELVGIPEPDSIHLKDLVGYEEQKKEVLRNTQQFIKGFGANNMLLYGDRGTGKSSTIKALIHEFGKNGMRMVEVTKYQLMNLSQIITGLKDRPYRFIIFVDDLSFEEHETEYKYLKAVLEGSLEPAPDNVRIYATSNRRHLIREYHSDRDKDELKVQDTLQEKLSLSDRFGITVVYLSPNQEEYLDIVEGIAKSKNIDIEPEKLRQMALKWELWHNHRSGRTAKQFIEDLLGKMASVETL